MTTYQLHKKGVLWTTPKRVLLARQPTPPDQSQPDQSGVTAPAKMTMSKKPVLWHINPVLECWTSSGHFCYFNPVSRPTLSILNPAAQQYLLRFKSPRSYRVVKQACLKQDPSAAPAHLRLLHQTLRTRQLLTPTPSSPLPSSTSSPRRLGVWLHLTNQCNLRCTYCYVTKTSRSFDPSLLPSTLNTVFRSAKLHGFRGLTLKISGGECLLRLNDVLKVVSIGRSLSKQYKVSFRPIVMTNATLITPRTASLLKRHRIHAAVSLDGLAKYHDQTRIFPSGLGSFAATIAGLTNLQSAKVSCNCLITITHKNQANLPALTHHLLSRNIPFAFNFYRENEAATDPNLLTSDQRLIDTLKSCYRLIAKNRPHDTLLRYLLDRVDLTHPHSQVCGRGKSYLVIGVDGSLYPCQMDLSHTPYTSHLGDDPISLMQSWGTAHPAERSTTCQNCLYQHYCAGGCPRLSTPTTPNPYCQIYQALIPYLLRLEAKRLIQEKYVPSN